MDEQGRRTVAAQWGRFGGRFGCVYFYEAAVDGRSAGGRMYGSWLMGGFMGIRFSQFVLAAAQFSGCGCRSQNKDIFGYLLGGCDFT